MLIIKEYVEATLQAGRFAVLATEGEGQPHASLIAFTPVEGFRQLLFATYRNTRKYRNLAQNRKVAVLIQGGDADTAAGFALTAFGRADEVGPAGHDAALRAHLARHPDLASFLRSMDCALMRVTVESYQVVNGIDDVKWWPVDDPAAARPDSP
jgi:nitroimidazol reductase NimA-like FMN-containing flavoprotein (pyridoxamine 5'-phosphate oxidase superfamily)